MEKIKAVIFDMDGLMFDTEPIYYKANQKAADDLDMDYSFSVYEEFIGSGDREYRERMREMYQSHGQEVLETFFEESTKELEHILLEGQVDKKLGLLSLLEYLKEEEIPAVVASSTNRELVDQLLERLDVLKYFKEVVGGDEVEAAKPDPAIFECAFEKTGIENKGEALILEDSKNGVLAAHGAGIPVLLIPDILDPDSEMEEKSVAVLSDLEEVIDYIKKKNK